MQPEISQDFSLLTVELRNFNFNQLAQPSNSALHFDISMATKAKKHPEGFIVVLEHSIKASQEDTELYNTKATILSLIGVKENFDTTLLKNVVAIMYSYLRPLIAQMTLMAKLPPLDIPPMNLSGLEVEIEK